MGACEQGQHEDPQWSAKIFLLHLNLLTTANTIGIGTEAVRIGDELKTH